MSDYSNFKNWITKWMDSKDWKPQKFQSEAWKEVLKGKSGLINAPTGSGKTLSLLPAIIWPTPIAATKAQTPFKISPKKKTPKRKRPIPTERVTTPLLL